VKIVERNSIGSNISLCRLEDGEQIVHKQSKNAVVESEMLRDLGKHIRVSNVYEADSENLYMEYIPKSGICDEERFAKELASLHMVKFERYGYEYDTTIGPHLQPNKPCDSWVEFFKNQRLLYMAERCFDEGAIEKRLFERTVNFAERIHNYILEPKHPSLIHGDIWGGNAMCKEGENVLIDPAIYCASYEMEIAFTLMFHTFSKRFYDVYSHFLPLEKDFFRCRAEILNLYPLLVHIRSFGGGYLFQYEKVLEKYGF